MWEEEEVFCLNDNTPESLFGLCLNYLIDHLAIITTLDPSSRQNPITVRKDVVLPAEICDKLLEAYHKKHSVNHNVINILRDVQRTRLTKIELQNVKVTEKDLRCLLSHKPKIVKLRQCEYVSVDSLKLFGENSENLVSLNINFQNQKQITPVNFHSEHWTRPDKLRSLTIHMQDFIQISLIPFCNLVHLDLSNCFFMPKKEFDALHHLQSLVLHNVPLSLDLLDIICDKKKLVHLDLSHDNERDGNNFNPDEKLHKIVSSLPKLESLDISGTNLAGRGAGVAAVVNEGPEKVELRCDIPGLISRVNNPLEFLGLYGTQNGACTRHDIPAKHIAGDANEAQTLVAARAYFHRPIILTKVLNDLYYLFRYDCIKNTGKALNIILRAMDQYLSEKHIQISGSASMYYIVKGKERDNIGFKLKRRIITVLLNAMEAHNSDDSMMRNGCITLCQFKIPADVFFEYERVVMLLLQVSESSQQWFIQRIAIYVLNSLACRVGRKRKRFLGMRGAITKMLHVISQRLEQRVCDDVMEVAWSTMWNVTDETPQNCESFLDNRGMELFQACLKSFPDNGELVRNMMGLLGNVAEVASLRPKLMTESSINVFYELLNSDSDGIEVSYNAAGVLAHIASDGPEAWTITEPSREAVLERMESAVQRWNRKAERNINYRSFKPILTLLNAHHTPQCQHWAVWALANLTTVYPEKYCHLVEEEDGLNMLFNLLGQPGPYATIKELALIVIDNCSRCLPRDKSPPDYSDN